LPGEPAISYEDNSMSHTVDAAEQIERWLNHYGGEESDVADRLGDSHPGEQSALLFEDALVPSRT
jgi:hypothetical protein